jgi:hypothetical protein
MIFEIVNDFETYIICCIAIVKMVVYSLRLSMANLSVSRSSINESEPTMASSRRPIISLTSIEASVRCAENSRVLALSSCLNRLIAGRLSEFSHLIKSQFYMPTNVQNVSITKLFESRIIYKDVFNSSSWRERQCKFLSGWQQICCVLTKIYGNTTAEQKNIVGTVCNVCDIINICSYYAMCDYSLKVEVGHLVGVGFMRRFIMRSLKMQLWLFECALADWLGIFCMVRITFRGNVVPWNQYCGSSSTHGVKREISCVIRKGEKQIQILDGY